MDLAISSWPLGLILAAFAVSAAVIAWAGSRLARAADRLADRTRMGEALTGTVVLGLLTALPGLAASVTAAVDGRPALAIANALGGIAVQTVFLAVADVFHSSANLEHAAASLANMVQTALLVLLLTLVMLGLTGPDVTIGHAHPVSLLLFVAAGCGLYMVVRTRNEPMWRPKNTPATVPDEPDEEARQAKLAPLILSLLVSAAVVTAAGIVAARASGAIADRTGLSESLVGGLLTGVATSLPELVTTVAAVRRRALTLAVSDIVGGNFFDVLFVVAADVVYLKGSLFHAPEVGRREQFIGGLTILLNVVLLLGLLFRQRRGPANIGFESLLMLILYLGGFFTLALLM